MDSRRKPTVEELGDLLVKTLWELDKEIILVISRLQEPAIWGDRSVRAVLGQFRRVYTNALAAGCELIGTSDDDWECIFDVDRPKEEWNLLNHLDLLGQPEGAD